MKCPTPFLWGTKKYDPFGSYFFVLFKRNGSENEEFSEWNPQAEFISAEENGMFQGF